MSANIQESPSELLMSRLGAWADCVITMQDVDFENWKERCAKHALQLKPNIEGLSEEDISKVSADVAQKSFDGKAIMELREKFMINERYRLMLEERRAALEENEDEEARKSLEADEADQVKQRAMLDGLEQKRQAKADRIEQDRRTVNRQIFLSNNEL